MEKKPSKVIQEYYDCNLHYPEDVLDPRKQLTISLPLQTALELQAIAQTFHQSFSSFIEEIIDDQFMPIVNSLELSELETAMNKFDELRNANDQLKKITKFNGEYHSVFKFILDVKKKKEEESE